MMKSDEARCAGVVYSLSFWTITSRAASICFLWLSIFQ